RPQHVHAVTLVEPDPLQPVQDRSIVRGDAGGRRRQRSAEDQFPGRARPGPVLDLDGPGTSEAAYACGFRPGAHQSSSRATTSGQRGTSALINALPALPNLAAASRSRCSRSKASAIARGSDWATIPVSSSRTNSSGPPLSLSVTTGRSAAMPSSVTYP